MKRILSLLCSFVLLVSNFSMPVYASETSPVSGEEASTDIEIPAALAEQEAGNPNFKVLARIPVTAASQPFGTRTQGLYYYDGYFLVNQATHYIVVQPDSGTELRIWLDTDNEVNVTAEYTNWFGYWHGFYDEDWSGENDFQVTNSCDGNRYRISIRTGSWATYSILVYQN